MADSSFDIVSKIDHQEVDNALGQAAREITQRYDFKGTGAEIKWSGDQAIEISANAEERAKAVLDVFKEKLIKRNQSLKILDAGEPRQSGRDTKISIALKEGITQENAKKVGKLIRDEGPKGVKVQVQGDELRVSSKKRDDLQAVIALVKGSGLRLRGAVHQLPLSRGGVAGQGHVRAVPVRTESAGPSRTADMSCPAADRVRSSAFGHRWAYTEA